MHQPPDNPAYEALSSGNASMAYGRGVVRFFDADVSPYAGFPVNYENGFAELHEQLPVNRTILFASRNQITYPKGWLVKHYVPGAQFVFERKVLFGEYFPDLVPLTKDHVEEMIALATLTRPGPFNIRTIEFGNYHGIFQQDKLVAMTGRRLHVNEYMEISAVCTHPGYTGRGYAQKLLKHQVDSILLEGLIPFLHVRADNAGAIAVYEKLGFTNSGPMHFYFMQRAE